MKRLSLCEISLWGRDFVSVVRIIEVIFTKNVWAFSRDQENCPYYTGVRNERLDCSFFETHFRIKTSDKKIFKL